MKKLLSVADFKEIKSVLKAQKQGDLVQAVNARDVHAWLGVGRDFPTWIKARLERCSFKDGVHYVVVENLTSPDSGSAKSRQRIAKEYFCSPEMVKHLCMLENNEKGALIRDYFIDCETIAKSKLEELEARKVSKVEFRPMTDAILEAHETPKPYHYSNECDMINRIIFGMTAAEFRLHHNMKKDDQLRDWLTPMQLTAVIELQRANTVLIKFGKTFQERKVELQSYFDRNYSQKLIQEIFALEA